MKNVLVTKEDITDLDKVYYLLEIKMIEQQTT